MKDNSQDVEIISNRQTSGKTESKLELKNFFNRKSLIIYTGSFVAIVAIVAFGFRNTGDNTSGSAVASSVSGVDSKISPVDEASEANVIANLAESANLPVAANTAQRSISLSIMKDINQDSETTLAKPQIVGISDNKNVSKHVVAEGESIDSIAESKGISVQTLKWSNNLKSDEVKPGTELNILPVDGVIHKVKADETPESIASKYGADTERVVSYNDLELGGLSDGKDIIIPNGVLPNEERPEYEAPKKTATTPNQTVKNNTLSNSAGTGVVLPSSRGSAGGEIFDIRRGVGSGSGPYAYGNCTQYVYERRNAMGFKTGPHWGNANTWVIKASAEGRLVGTMPQVGAVLYEADGYYGHVSVVEEITGDYVIVSEMNNYAGGGFAGTNKRRIPISVAVGFQYIY